MPDTFNYDMNGDARTQYLANFARSNGLPVSAVMQSANNQPSVNDVYPDTGAALPDPSWDGTPPIARSVAAPVALDTAPVTGAAKEVQSKSALDDLLGQMAVHRTADAAQDRNNMWMTFFSNLAANKSPSLGGAIADASSTLGPSMQTIQANNRARDYEGLKAQIAGEQFKQEQALKQQAQDQNAPLRAAQANYYNSRADNVASGAGGRGSVAQWKYNTWLEAHPDDTEGALQYVAGHKTMDDTAVNKNALNMAAGDKLGIDPDGTMTPEDKVSAYTSLLKTGKLPPSVVKAKPKGFFASLFGGDSDSSDAMVSVVSPDGTPGKMPASKLAAAKIAGYKEQ